MIRKLNIYFASLLLGIAVTSCSDSLNDINTPLVPDSPGTVTISFKNSESTRSEASDNSEKLIDNLFIALYVDGASETQLPAAVAQFKDLAASGSTTVTMQLTEDMVTALFNDVDGAECRMYAVANLPAEASIPANPTIGQLKQINISAPFDTRKVQTSFVMAGEGKVKYVAPEATEARGKASGTGTLYRAAAKIRLNIQLPEKIEIKDGENVVETWIPLRNGIQVLLNNGVKSAIAAPLPDAEGNPWEPTEESQYYTSDFSVTNSVRSLAIADGATSEYPYTMDVPFYTFPNAWTENVNETGKTTMTLMVPWQLEGEQSWTTYYYQVPVVPSTLTHIDRNYSYNINLKVGMLGSLIPDTPVELPDLSYQVLNWGQEDIDVAIQDYRYLVVNPNVISVQNEGEFLIPFYSSHPVEIEDISMTFKRFNFYSNGNGEEVSIEVPQTKLDASVTDGTKMVSYEIVTDAVTNQKSLKINHALEIWTPVNAAGQEVALTGRNGNGNNTLAAVTNSIVKFERPATPEAPYSAYTFTVKIQHGDNSAYSEDITITQYPAMYISADRNPGNGTTTASGGNVYVNNGYTGGNNNTLGSIATSLSGNNSNPNMYEITVSQLDAESKYVIGDPRTLYYQNTLSTTNNAALPIPTSDGVPAGQRTNNNGMTGNNWCASAPAL